ncbi:MAG: Restriction Enzyme Adenine Methylase Associated, partial [Bacteroidota bacterium]
MKAGALEPDTKIRMSRVNGDIIEATITDQGQLKLSTGELFNTPSSAARFVR